MLFDAPIAHAATFSQTANNAAIKTLVPGILNAIVTPAVGLLFIAAGLVFIWGVFGLISHADDPTARKDGQNHILWGIIGMFIMVSAYGIIRLIGNTVTGSDPFL